MSKTLRWMLVIAVCGSFCTGLFAGALLEPVPAPEWKVSEWINGNPGQLSNLRGKIVLIEFFQLWCPGCRGFSIPLFKKWDEQFGSRDDVVLVSIHTVFEGHDRQTPERLRSFVEELGITRPVGIDAYKVPGDPTPITMDRFETGGTPHIVIVDRQGDIVFSHFGAFETGPVEGFIERLIQDKKDKASDRSRSTRSEPRDRGSRSSKSKRTRPEPTPKRSTPPSRKQPDEVETDISGTYKVTFEQTDKDCGDLIPAMDVLAEVTVRGDKIEIRSTRPYLGLRTLTAPYDPTTGRFEGTLTDSSRESGVSIELNLELSGSIEAGAVPPEIQYQFSVTKTGSEPGWNCVIEGEGEGKLSIPRRR